MRRFWSTSLVEFLQQHLALLTANTQKPCIDLIMTPWTSVILCTADTNIFFSPSVVNFGIWYIQPTRQRYPCIWWLSHTWKWWWQHDSYTGFGNKQLVHSGYIWYSITGKNECQITELDSTKYLMLQLISRWIQSSILPSLNNQNLAHWISYLVEWG